MFHPKILKFLGQKLPWPKLNHLMEIGETLNLRSRSLYETELIAQMVYAPASRDWVALFNSVIPFRIFLIAGTDTTSTALSRILYLLALHLDVQDMLRKELNEAHDGIEELTYDQLVSLPFLEAVCRETLRL